MSQCCRCIAIACTCMFYSHDLTRCTLNCFVDNSEASTCEDKQLAYASRQSVLGVTDFLALRVLGIGLPVHFHP